jgi:peptide/nickel transport system substrate-binding protein
LTVGSFVLSERKLPVKKIGAVVIIIVIVAAGVLGYYYQTLQKPAVPKIVTYASLSEMVTLDPSTEFSNSILILTSMYEPLIWYQPWSNPVFQPGLATSWESSNNSQTWVFHLRQGVKFHDGTDFNATAVKYSINRTITLGQGAAYIWSSVKQINILDTYTVQFILSSPTPLDVVACASYGAWIMSPQIDSLAKAAGFPNASQWFNAGHDDGTGPYTITKWDPQNEVDMQKVPGYWGGWTSDQYDTAVVKIVRDETVQEEMVKSGEIQIAEYVPPADIPSLQADPNLKVVATPQYQTLYGLLNNKKFPFNNTLIRQAVSYAIPYQDMVTNVLHGFGNVSVGPIPHGMPGHFNNITQYTYNLAKAKQLLAQAGYPNGGFNLLLTYTAGDVREEGTSELIANSLKALNINVQIRAMAWEQQWSLAQGPFQQAQDIFIFYWWPTILSPYDFLLNMFHTESSPVFNLGYYYHSDFDNMIDTAYAEEGSNRPAAYQLYYQAENKLVNDAGALFLWDLTDVHVLRSNISGFQYDPLYTTAVLFYQLHQTS